MADNNAKTIDKAFADFAKRVDQQIFGQLDAFCKDLLRKAVWERLHSTGAHQFTGNLVNSIVVCMYRRSTGKKYNYYAYNSVKLPIRRELSSLSSRGRRRKNRIWFRPGSRFGSVDWSGNWSSLDPEKLVATDESWGQNDALSFASHWHPISISNDFSICVAYTSEYASFVENERQTTGYLNTLDYAERMAIEYYQLKPAA